VKDRVKKDIGTKEPFQDWSTINWKTVKKRIRNLRQRIYRATQSQQWNRVRSLMKLKKAGGRRQRAEGTKQKGILTPPVLGPLNHRFQWGTQTLAHEWSRQKTEDSIPSASCPLPSAFLVDVTQLLEPAAISAKSHTRESREENGGNR
jgi:hypothetical protein